MIVQPIATVAAAVAGAATVILSAASVSNVYETYSLVRQRRRQLQQTPPESPSHPPSVAQTEGWASADEAVEGLSRMKKRDLVELFMHCDSPETSGLAFCDEGEGWRYDGYLLDNGPILVSDDDCERSFTKTVGEKPHSASLATFVDSSHQFHHKQTVRARPSLVGKGVSPSFIFF